MAKIPLMIALIAAVFALWASDFVTFNGERTIYTADCLDGSWQERRCTGHLVAGERYRFRALKAHAEVLFWRAGHQEPSSKFSGCRILSGREWSCTPNGEESATIAYEMRLGRAVPGKNGRTRSFHPISKWRWYLLSWRLPAGRSAGI